MVAEVIAAIDPNIFTGVIHKERDSIQSKKVPDWIDEDTELYLDALDACLEGELFPGSFIRRTLRTCVY